MAMQYEDEYTKNQILNQYLNTASYGTNDGKTAVGVEAASQVYFDKDVSDLNVGEAALLAGLPQAPTDYNPFINPKGAKERRNEVLEAMRDQGYISPATYAKVSGAGLGLHRGYHYEVRTQQYFFDFVQQELIDKYGVATAREGGLKVYTTLDPRLQAVAEQAIAAHPVSGAAEALVSTDVDTGEIKAMASSSSYDVSQFNLAATGAAPARLLVQALRAHRGGRPGHRPGHDLLPGAGLDHPLSVRVLRRGLDRQRRRRRLDQPPRRDRELGQHRLRAAGHRHRLGRRWTTWRRRWASPARSPGPGRRARRQRRDRARPVQRLRDDRQRRRPPRPDRDRQGRLPRRPRRRAGEGARQPGGLRRRRLHGRRRDDRDARLRHRRVLRHPLPGGRQDRDHRGAGRRLVRRLHPARLDRGLGRQPGLPHRRCPATAPISRRRSGTTTWRSRRPSHATTSREPQNPAPRSRATTASTRRPRTRAPSDTDTTDAYGRTPDDTTTTPDATTDGAERLRPRPLRARRRPGPAPTPGTGGGRRRRRDPELARAAA